MKVKFYFDNHGVDGESFSGTQTFMMDWPHSCIPRTGEFLYLDSFLPDEFEPWFGLMYVVDYICWQPDCVDINLMWEDMYYKKLEGNKRS